MISAERSFLFPAPQGNEVALALLNAEIATGTGVVIGTETGNATEIGIATEIGTATATATVAENVTEETIETIEVGTETVPALALVLVTVNALPLAVIEAAVRARGPPVDPVERALLASGQGNGTALKNASVNVSVNENVSARRVPRLNSGPALRL